ncbi:hypothetical protein BH09CHL1_BH09CHL1_17540 [soil metagenome]
MRWVLIWLPVALLLIAAHGTVGAEDRSDLAPDNGFYWGVDLAWEKENPASFNADFGQNAAMFGGSYAFPLTADGETALTRTLNQIAAQGALALITLNPSVSLSDITPAMADDFASRLAATSTRFGVPVLVRFAPEMNGSWVSWGQQPAAYVAAFRNVAEAVHHRAPQAVMVWSPVIATGYPFGGGEFSAVPGSADSQVMDTNGDGQVSNADDPYAPFYPGDDVVDWVGIRFLYWGNTYPYGANLLPDADRFSSVLHGRSAESQIDFPAIYADQRSKPFLLETAALFNPEAEAAGVTATGIKSAWMGQILNEVATGALPSLKALIWFDHKQAEGEVGGATVDWSISDQQTVAQSIVSNLAQSGAQYGPVFEGNAPTADLAGHELVRAALIAIAIAAFLMLLVAVVAPDKVRWHYQERADKRDLRIDFLRGVAMLFVVVDHIDMPSLFHLISHERLGVVSGAELFVFLSGGVLGLVYRRRIEREGWVETAPKIFRRAGTLYVVAVGVSLIAFALTYSPRADASMLTTWTDKSTSVVYRLYPDPNQTDLFARSVAFLRSGPSQFNIMGLYVVLMLIAPFLLFVVAAPGFKAPGINASVNVGRMWERRRFAVPLLLVLSWGLYILQQIHPVKIFNAQFEDPFPLFSWQVLFVHGIIAGYYRSEIIAWFQTRLGRFALAVCSVLFFAGLFFAWNNPYLESNWDVRLDIIPANDFVRIYNDWFNRAQLEPGRLLNTLVAVVVLYAILTICWKPLDRAFGWFLIPIGAASLYVFIWQVFFSMIIANISLFQRENVLTNTLGHTIVLLIVWVMVKREFLYRFIPR